MAATRVMKFWAVCLAVLGKLLASLGVSAAAAAARREAAMYGDGADGTPDAAPDPVPGPDPVPLYGRATAARRMSEAGGQLLPPTIKQRIRAEAHGGSPTLRSRLATGAEPLHTVPAGPLPHTGTEPDEVPVRIPAARRRAHADCAA
ncbi:DUF6344 domain-containing protein [Streptomyces piniterrae]|uniref:DUF6344 domain-containing protein n=1 Tax=Streptomyces piniterrae TaxID=2571125 RepID=UPI001C9E87A4|nr:DUF6344 domain-containing protein [Streptomyces piniterrae]